jgi:hypothetical protein
MTPEQQEALRARVRANPACAEALATRDLDQIAALLNAEGLATVGECWADALALMNRCATGKSIIRKLYAGNGLDPVVEVAWRALVYGKGLDFGAESTRESIDEMVGPLGFTADEVGEMKGLALQPVTVSRDQVFDALFNDNGSEK